MEYSRVTTVSRACMETYILINGRVFVFIAMRESCENSELGSGIYAGRAKLSSCAIRVKNEVIEKYGNVRGRIALEISDSL